MMTGAFRLIGRGAQFFALVLAITLAAWAVGAHAQSTVTVRWVVDGDTIVLNDGRHVRYIGIDAPEIDHANRRAEPMAYAARSLNRQLVHGWQLQLVFDPERSDRFGRVLAYVYRSDGLFINAELIRQGCAYFLYRSPNTSQTETLLAAQQEAMLSGRGIWQFVEPTAAPKHPYTGNRRSRRFHAHDCSMAQKISSANRIKFDNQWAAFWSGYAPARECIVFPPER